MNDDRRSIKHLRQVLADTFILYMKTYAVHWNYTGAKFFSVHKLTEEQYQELAEAVDEIAERLRAMGHSAPISLHDILNASNLREIKAGGAESPEAILRELAEGHKLLSKRAKEAADVLDEEDDDFGNDRMIARIGAHDKAAWMLNSLLA